VDPRRPHLAARCGPGVAPVAAAEPRLEAYATGQAGALDGATHHVDVARGPELGEAHAAFRHVDRFDPRVGGRGNRDGRLEVRIAFAAGLHDRDVQTVPAVVDVHRKSREVPGAGRAALDLHARARAVRSGQGDVGDRGVDPDARRRCRRHVARQAIRHLRRAECGRGHDPHRGRRAGHEPSHATIIELRKMTGGRQPRKPRNPQRKPVSVGSAGAVVAFISVLAFVIAGAAYVFLPRGAQLRMNSGACRGCNVLLITIDTLRLDRVGAYGSRRNLTPTLDRLAAEGLTFRRAYASAPLTLPSPTSIMTAVSSPVPGVPTNGLSLPAPTLA